MSEIDPDVRERLEEEFEDVGISEVYAQRDHSWVADTINRECDFPDDGVKAMMLRGDIASALHLSPTMVLEAPCGCQLYFYGLTDEAWEIVKQSFGLVVNDDD